MLAALLIMLETLTNRVSDTFMRPRLGQSPKHVHLDLAKNLEEFLAADSPEGRLQVLAEQQPHLWGPEGCEEPPSALLNLTEDDVSFFRAGLRLDPAKRATPQELLAMRFCWESPELLAMMGQPGAAPYGH